MALPNVTDLKAHLNMEDVRAHDDELAHMLDAAVDVVEGIIGPLSAAPVTEVHRNVHADVIVLRQCPVIALTAVSRRGGGGVRMSLPLTDFELESEAGLLRSATDGLLVGSFEVSYSAGRASVPAAVRLAVLIIAAHLFETQTRPGFSSSAPAGFGGADGIPDAGMSGGSGYAIPHRATDLLRAYMSGPAIA